MTAFWADDSRRSSRRDYLVEYTASLLEDGRDVGETLTRLFLDGRARDLTSGGILRSVPETNTNPAAFTAWLYVAGGFAALGVNTI
jgi:hypothetical protein